VYCVSERMISINKVSKVDLKSSAIGNWGFVPSNLCVFFLVSLSQILLEIFLQLLPTETINCINIISSH
jgi:hypothetical protein